MARNSYYELPRNAYNLVYQGDEGHTVQNAD